MRSPRTSDSSRSAAGVVRLMHVMQLAATLPRPSLEMLLTPRWEVEYPAFAPSEIVPGLFQGGTEDDDIVQVGRDELYAHHSQFDFMVTLYASALPAPWGVEECRFGFYDAELGGEDSRRVARIAVVAFERWVSGDCVLVRCQAGLNRSGLVTALILIRAGLAPAQAIGLVRDRRSAVALCNDDFVRWLVDAGELAIADALDTRRGLMPSMAV